MVFFLLLLNLASALAAPTPVSRDSVNSAIRKNIDAIRECYEKAVRRGNPSLSGRIVVEFSIEDNGKAGFAKISQTTMNNSTVETCLMDVVKKTQFPKANGKNVLVLYPFNFEPPKK